VPSAALGKRKAGPKASVKQPKKKARTEAPAASGGTAGALSSATATSDGGAAPEEPNEGTKQRGRKADSLPTFATRLISELKSAGEKSVFFDVGFSTAQQRSVQRMIGIQDVHVQRCATFGKSVLNKESPHRAQGHLDSEQASMSTCVGVPDWSRTIAFGFEGSQIQAS
jgi:hypothetical protein